MPALGACQHRAGADAPDAAVAAYLARLEGYGFAGGVSIVRPGAAPFHSTHGLADQEARTRWAADTVFDTGSVTKQFTAAGVLALEADGGLAVSDPIGAYLLNAPADKRAITIHHLLTHTSGMAEAFGGDDERVTREAFLAQAMAAPLLAAPGARYAYSNAGYGVLAAIIEIASGMGVDEFMRQRLFAPAGMGASGYILPAAALARAAQGYEEGVNAQLVSRARALGAEKWNLIGNGGLYSTLEDLARWTAALDGDGVLPAPARAKLFAPHVAVAADYRGSGRALFYGYGWFVWSPAPGRNIAWHLGGNGITNAALRRLDGVSVIYASNVSEFHDPAYPVPAAERMLAGEDVPPPPRVTPRPLEALAGAYAGADGERLVLTAARGFLRAAGEGQGAYHFAAAGAWRDTPELAALNALTHEAVELGRTRQFAALAALFESAPGANEIEAFEAAFWRRRHEAYGAHVRTQVLGSSAAGVRFAGRTVVGIEFERGMAWREYFWTPAHRIGDLGPLDRPPSTRFFPIGGAAFAAVDPATARSTHIRIEDAALYIAGAPAMARIR